MTGPSIVVYGATMNAAPAPSPEWCLFLDVDGTLLEIADTPGEVRVDEALKGLLLRVAQRLDGAVALVSGRSIAMLDALFAPLILPAAGQHGLERRSASGARCGAAASAAPLDPARTRLAAFIAAHPGTLLEDKGGTLAVHFRRAPELEPRVRDAVSAAAALLGAGYDVQGGKMVLEIKPAGVSKGSAAAEFMREPPFARRTPVFVGDDATDESGLRFAEAAGGLSIAVGDRIRGRWRLEDPGAVRRWLADIADGAA